MSWTIDFRQDTEVKGVGTATANYEDAVSGLQFSTTARLDTNDGQSIDAFITQALAQLDAKQTDVTDKLAVISKIETVLNDKVK